MASKVQKGELAVGISFRKSCERRGERVGAHDRAGDVDAHETGRLVIERDGLELLAVERPVIEELDRSRQREPFIINIRAPRHAKKQKETCDQKNRSEFGETRRSSFALPIDRVLAVLQACVLRPQRSSRSILVLAMATEFRADNQE